MRFGSLSLGYTGRRRQTRTRRRWMEGLPSVAQGGPEVLPTKSSFAIMRFTGMSTNADSAEDGEATDIATEGTQSSTP